VAGRRFAQVAALAAALVTGAPAFAQQDIGHRVPGTLGLDAGVQLDPGLYFADRIALYDSGKLIDRFGNPLPIRADIDAFFNAIGIAAAFEIPQVSTYYTATISIPFARVTINTDNPQASLDRFGLGDVYFAPLQLGWRAPHWDAITSYAVYIPTGGTEPGGRSGVGMGQWTHELSLGGTAYFDRARTWTVSALMSYDLNQRKQNIDITRGDTIQVQGGVGKTLFGFVDVGLAGYGQWQVTADSGSALPPVLRGLSDQAAGLGPEIGAFIARIRTRVSFRYERDIYDRSRPQGQILIGSLAFVAWQPRSAARPQKR
jgi:hypothetical protein